MTIDTTGKWWKGSEFADIEAYLRALEPGGYPVHRVIQARCICGSTVFHLEVDQEEELAQTICVQCKRAQFIADSEEHLSQSASPHRVKCPGRHDHYEVGLGLCIREGQWVRWMSIGLRCTSCGILSSPLDWKSDLDLTDPASTRIG